MKLDGWIAKPKVINKGTGVEVEMKDLITCKNCKYFVISPDFSCCKLTEAIVGEDDFCSKGKR